MPTTGSHTESGVCIIGAGPAGVAASIRLSQLGISHLLVDASEFPRNKPCGDIITSPVLRVLHRLEPGILEQLKAGGYLNPIWQSLVFPPGGESISLNFIPLDNISGEASCYSVSRFNLDAVLLEKVRNSRYATFREGFRIKSLENRPDTVLLEGEDGSQIRAALVILASGSGGSLLAKAGLPVPDHDCAVGIRAHFENVRWSQSQTGLFLLPSLMPGGLYITPLPGGRCNVNLVLSLRKIQKDKIRLRELLEETIASLPQLNIPFADARICGNPEGSRLFLGIRSRRVSANRLLLAGDAAGLIEFFSGNGIPQAYGSGMLAAETAAQAVRNNTFSPSDLQQYDQVLRQKYASGIWLNRLVFNLLHHPFVAKMLLRFLGFLASRQHANELLGQLVYERNPASRMMNPAFWYRLLFVRKSCLNHSLVFQSRDLVDAG